jgi:hypothetical protein
MPFAPDKIMHFILGVVVSVAAILAFGEPFAGVLAALVVGAAKEGWDALGHGTPEFMDALATVIGGFVPAAIMLASAA